MYPLLHWMEFTPILRFMCMNLLVYVLAHPLLHLILSFNQKYRSLTWTKKSYVVSNFLQFFVMLNVTIVWLTFMITGFRADTSLRAQLRLIVDTHLWKLHQSRTNNMLVNGGTMYAITNIVAIVANRKMALFTVIHHWGVLFAYVAFIFYVDLAEEGVFKGIIGYGIATCATFSVHLFLASRFILPAQVSAVLKKIAAGFFVPVMSINFTWQIFYFIKLLWIGQTSLFAILAYFITIAIWIYDEYFLFRYLISKEQPAQQFY